VKYCNLSQGDFMKRFHVHVGVKNLNESIQFYSTLFGQKPTKLKEDYAKWMLEDPKINFAISERGNKVGVDHLGIQVDNEVDLSEMTNRLKTADLEVYDEGASVCCYAESNKAWAKDPSGIAWEAYHTMAEAEVFGDSAIKVASCLPKAKTTCC
jgi:catechol 2,3-dioxygenase-like lactoylglutathione lyase family enzyme